ncbi:hypothetical protein POVCU1_081410, partial [Plasmodium ovale curtisi]
KHVFPVKKSEEFKRWRYQNLEIQRKNQIKEAFSNEELNMFGENIVGGYTSSEKGTTFCRKKNKVKEKDKLSIHDDEKCMSKKLKEGHSPTDQSYEYIESNETPKKKNNCNGRSRNRRNNGSSDGMGIGKIKGRNDKMDDHINLIKKKVHYTGIYGYDRNNDKEKKPSSAYCDDIFLPSKKHFTIQPLKMKYNYLISPPKNQRSYTTNTKKILTSKNALPLFDIEGELWYPKSEKKKFVPSFGNE